MKKYSAFITTHHYTKENYTFIKSLHNITTLPTNMQNLPMDIVNEILEYSGYHIFRHGKYMKRIHKDDYRYAVLSNKLFANVIQSLNSKRRYFIMLSIDGQRWLCLMKDIFYDYIEIYLTEKQFPLKLNESQSEKVKKYGYGVLTLGYGTDLPCGFAIV